MTEDEEKQLLIVLAGTFAVAVVAQYVRVKRINRKRRKQIENWEQSTSACIKGYEMRLLEALNDDNVTAEEFRLIWNEENAFLNIVMNRPMY